MALALLTFISGCSKDEEPEATPTMSNDEMMSQADDMGDMDEMDMMANAGAAEAAGIEQKTCPVMEGNPIDPNIFVEYEGKKVYFCCPACPEKFKADPEKYLAKLPQFQQ
jgi:YHS domain-containing protein